MLSRITMESAGPDRRGSSARAMVHMGLLSMCRRRYWGLISTATIAQSTLLQ